MILTNTGNPHALGQKPLTFYRQALALVTYPPLLESPEASRLFPADVIERAKTYVYFRGRGVFVGDRPPMFRSYE